MSKTSLKTAIVLFTFLALACGSYAAQALPRYAFYHLPLAEEKTEYSPTCYPAGTIMAVLPGNKCCSWLNVLQIIDEQQKECAPITGTALCTDCGNAKCEFGENNCNCVQDCNATMTAKPVASGEIECSDHFDNDGDGFCDASVAGGYCSDGSHLGDKKCQSPTDSETAQCVSKQETCNGFDDDCDGVIDNVLETRPCGLDMGACVPGIQTRQCFMGQFGEWSNCEEEKAPAAEICGDNIDNDCDNQTDETCAATQQQGTGNTDNTITTILLIAGIALIIVAIMLILKRRN